MINKMLIIGCELGDNPTISIDGEPCRFIVTARTEPLSRVGGKVVITYDSKTPVEVGSWVGVEILPWQISNSQ